VQQGREPRLRGPLDVRRVEGHEVKHEYRRSSTGQVDLASELHPELLEDWRWKAQHVELRDTADQGGGRDVLLGRLVLALVEPTRARLRVLRRESRDSGGPGVHDSPSVAGLVDVGGDGVEPAGAELDLLEVQRLLHVFARRLLQCLYGSCADVHEDLVQLARDVRGEVSAEALGELARAQVVRRPLLLVQLVHSRRCQLHDGHYAFRGCWFLLRHCR
jgi:hypothetical protein